MPDIGMCRSLTPGMADRKSTRLNSSHGSISYAVFCLKKKMFSAHSLPVRTGEVGELRCFLCSICEERCAYPIGLRRTVFFFNDTATTEIYTLSLHDALPI